MPSPKTPDAPRRFTIFFKGDSEPVTVRAEDRYKAKEKVIADIVRVRPDLDYKSARFLIRSCRIEKEDQMSRGPKPGFKRSEARGRNDHSVPHW